MNMQPTVGIVGVAGAYGRWLERFFERRMGLRVIGCDPAGSSGLGERELVEQSDVLVFSAPIRQTPSLIDHYVAVADGIERGRLWMDVTSIKAAPVAALMRSRAEVVGLHPMCAPPRTATLKGHAMVVCEARLEQWQPWLETFLAASQADCGFTDPQTHDRAMALVQGMVHASHLAQVAVRREWMGEGPGAMRDFRTVGAMLDDIVSRRLLAGNPVIYQDIQFENPHVGPMLDRFIAHLTHLRRQIEAGDDQARAGMRAGLLDAGAAYFGDRALATGSHAFEQLGYLMADLDEPGYLSVFLPEDRPGSLRALLSVFETRGISLESIHSSRTTEGALHFRIGFGAGVGQDALAAAAQSIEDEGIGRVIDRGN